MSPNFRLRQASSTISPFRLVEDGLRPIPTKGWAEMIRKVYQEFLIPAEPSNGYFL